MPFIQKKCKICGKTAETLSVFKISGITMLSLKCGHMIKQEQIASKDPSQIIALNHNRLMKFQIDGVKFLEQAGGRALILDEMGLGKTVQALAFLYLHMEEMFPAVFVVKSSLMTQWQRQFENWCSDDYDEGYRFAQILSSSKDTVLPGMPAYITSFDLIPRFNIKDSGKFGHDRNRLEEMLVKRGAKTLIIDECQQIKNPDSKRAIELRDLAQHFKYVIGLSGTPIKNNAGEFFSILNIVMPQIFPVYARFLREDVSSIWTGYATKVGGLRDPEAFKKKTESFIIRRERQEVLPDLPVIQRQFMFNELGGKVEQEYIKVMKDYQKDFFDSAGLSAIQKKARTLAYMSRMRHITGYAKIEPCLDFLMEFLASTDDQRICVFSHHLDVAEILHDKLKEICKQLQFNWTPMNLVGLGAEVREADKDSWIKSNSRILQLSSLASGEGLDGLQTVCHKMVSLERQWNPANEDQVEGRFSRIGHMVTAENKVDNTFFVAVGTIDEFFAEIVEKKREIVDSTLKGKAAPSWDESSIIQELAEVLAVSGGKKWGF